MEFSKTYGMEQAFCFTPVFRFIILVCFFVFPGTAGFSEDVPAENRSSRGYSHEDIKRGERFFKGILPFDREGPSCVSCHNIVPADTLNWNPSAIDIAVKWAELDFPAFQTVVMQPPGEKLSEVHTGIQMGEDDLRTVKAYLDDLALSGPPVVKPAAYNLLIFLLLGLLITWAIAEMIFLRKIRYKAIPLAVFLVAFGLQVGTVIREGRKLGLSQEYAPVQPIKFSHKLHAGDNGIDCKYCHHTAEYGKSAGFPAMNLCMNCHILVREGTHSGKFEIAKVVNAVENREPVAWIRLHNLPDHVFFSHAVHVGAAGLDCTACHGPVNEMDVVRQHADLSMGWCVNCHRETEVAFADNGYYETFIKLHGQYKIDDLKHMTAADAGANDCMKCHY